MLGVVKKKLQGNNTCNCTITICIREVNSRTDSVEFKSVMWRISLEMPPEDREKERKKEKKYFKTRQKMVAKKLLSFRKFFKRRQKCGL